MKLNLFKKKTIESNDFILNDREYRKKIQKNSLLNYFGNIYSQRGQDGILQEIFRRLDISQGVFVEFGAWDGVYLSNSRFLFEKGWAGIFIEGNEHKFTTLKKNYDKYDDIILINRMVEIEGSNSLSSLLSQYNTKKIDLLSIDIDGYDLEILASIENSNIRPTVIVIEGGSNFSPYLEKKIPIEIANNNIQQPLAVITSVAKNLGYIPICFHQDLYLVLNTYQNLFNNISLEPVDLFFDSWNFSEHNHRKFVIDNHNNNKLFEYELNLEPNKQLSNFL
jgi:hypothetical protein